MPEYRIVSSRRRRRIRARPERRPDWARSAGVRCGPTLEVEAVIAEIRQRARSLNSPGSATEARAWQACPQFSLQAALASNSKMGDEWSDGCGQPKQSPDS